MSAPPSVAVNTPKRNPVISTKGKNNAHAEFPAFLRRTFGGSMRPPLPLYPRFFEIMYTTIIMKTHISSPGI